MTIEANDRLSGANLCSIHHRADHLADAAIISYWMEGRVDGCFEFHRKYILEDIRKLADLCGYVLVPKPVALDAPDAQSALKAEGVE